MSSTADLVSPEPARKPAEDGRSASFRAMTAKQKWRRVRDLITVEPIIACYVIAPLLCDPALKQLEMEKACRANCAYNDTICDTLIVDPQSYPHENTHVHRLIAQMNTWRTPLESVMPVILVLFLGSYSDRHRLRKPFVLAPIFGEFFAVVGCIASSVFMRQWPLEVQGILQTVVPSFFGGITMFMMAIFSYIADISSTEMRTLNLGIVQIVIQVCSPIVSSFSVVLFKRIGYVPILSLAGVIYAIGFLYGLFRIQDVKARSDGDGSTAATAKKSLFKDLFDHRLLIETFAILFKRKPGNKRFFIWLIMLVFFVVTGVAIGEWTVSYLYTNRAYNWTVVEFTYCAAAINIINTIGFAVALPFFTQFLKVSDFMLILVAIVDKIVSVVIVLIFASSMIGYCTGIVVGLINGIAMVGLRSSGTKVVCEDDLGKAQSLFALMQAIAPTVSGPAYNTIYDLTLETYTSAYFFLSLVCLILVCAPITIMYIKDRREKSRAIDDAATSDGGKKVPENNVEMTRF